MDDLISREELKARFKLRINWLEKDVHDEYSKGLYHGAETDATLIDEIPAAKVERVVHGRWMSDGLGDGERVCSVCGSYALYTHRDRYDQYLTPYCPKCGAKMDSER